MYRNPGVTDSYQTQLRLSRPHEARMQIIKVDGKPAASRFGTVWITHIGELTFRYRTPLRIPSNKTIVLGFEIRGENEWIRFRGRIDKRDEVIDDEGYSYTVVMEMGEEEEASKLRRWKTLVVEQTVSAMDRAARAYTMLQELTGFHSWRV